MQNINTYAKKRKKNCRQCGAIKHTICLEHHNFPKSKINRIYKTARYTFRKTVFGFLRKITGFLPKQNLTTIMPKNSVFESKHQNKKICSNCLLPQPLKMFATTKNGHWIHVQKCLACRRTAKPFGRFWEGIKSPIKERNRMARRARMAGVSVVIPFTKAEIIKRDGLNCYLCKKLLSHKTATIDHVVPLSKGGFHSPTNAKICCARCNSVKGDRLSLDR